MKKENNLKMGNVTQKWVNVLKKTCERIINENKDIITIVLAGSRARGDYMNESDFDLMFITKGGSDMTIAFKYQEKIARKTKIPSYLIQVKLWTNKFFNERYSKGDSFVYCAIRDGKILASRNKKFENKLPDCRKAAKERLSIAKKNLGFIKYTLEENSERRISGSRAEFLGFCAMHISWAVCMMRNFCPLSKHTVLKEIKKYFNENEFQKIKRAYKFYSHPKFERQNNIKSVEKLYYNLNKILNKVEKGVL